MAKGDTHPVPGAFPACVEHSVWTAPPFDPPAGADTPITLPAAARSGDSSPLVMHLIGCSGSFGDNSAQLRVAGALVADASASPPPSLLLHLGDVVYVGQDKSDANDVDQESLYAAQFFEPYAAYPAPIYAIAGNHDGKLSDHKHLSAIHHFMRAFCGLAGGPATKPRSLAEPQPYLYFRLETPKAQIVCLYANIANGGILDDPHAPAAQPQLDWLTSQLGAAGAARAGGARKAIILAVHYPPFSAAASFAERGDPALGPTMATGAVPLGAVLRRAYDESGVRPDLVVSAHAHHYQRLTYRFADGFQLPHVIAGNGGHGPIEALGEACDGTLREHPAPPFPATAVPGLQLPHGDSVELVAFNDRDHGFMRLTIADGAIEGELIVVDKQGTRTGDSFAIDLAAHAVADRALR